MKILIATPLGKITLSLANYFKKAFIGLGHYCEIFSYVYDRFTSKIKLPLVKSLELSFIEQKFYKKISRYLPDLIIVINGENFSSQVINKVKERCQIKTALLSTDDPYSLDNSVRISPFYDYCFTTDSGSISAHRNAGCLNVKFIPFGCMSEIHKRLNLSEEDKKLYGSDIVFIGGITPYRLGILEKLADFNLKIWSPRNFQQTKNPLPSSLPVYSKITGKPAWDEEMVKIYNASKIVLNIYSLKISADNNMRLFEAPACGVFTLTEKKNILPNLFKDKEEIVFFENIAQLKELINYYLDHPEEREAIAKKGQKRAYRDHTYFKRAEEFLSFLKG